MNPKLTLLPIFAVGVAAALLAPSRVEGYALAGFGLDTSQRDVRVFNNFGDASANDNTTPDPNFPGFTGAPLAIWKGVTEWASRPHGNGDGDPSQPGGLGSGGANFDATFQGLAANAGVISENIISEISGSGGGVLAFTETAGNAGWRMRFYAAQTWADGPDTNLGAGQLDLQAVACHEYGHALGLGHTSVANATMIAAIIGNGTVQRTIEADDIGGVQAIYGAASAQKPIITSVTVAPGTITIAGSNFSSTGNQVWFTRTGTTGNGDPVVVSNVSSNGTSLTVANPFEAGPGDVLVKANSSGYAALSNAWPVAPFACGGGFYNYCFSSPNTFDPNGAYMSFQGNAFVSANAFTLVATGCPPSGFGLFFAGTSEAFATFGNGFRCIAGPVIRLALVQASASGAATFHPNFTSPQLLNQITGNSTWKFQYWYRNPAAGGAGFNLSDGLSVTFCP